MYSLTVRDNFMIAHSFVGEMFGPAQGLHGATYVVELTFRRRSLDANGVVIDIGFASELLAAVLKPLRYANLDDLPEFSGLNTTTEFLAGDLFGRIVKRLNESDPSGPKADAFASIAVVVRESPDAWAAYESAVS